MTRRLTSQQPAPSVYEWPFFAWVYALSLPIWITNPFLHSDLLPDHLPLLDALGTFVATIAACILVYQQRGLDDVKNLLWRAFDARRVQHPYYWVFSIAIMPLLVALTYLISVQMNLIKAGSWLPDSSTLIALVLFLVAAAGEEIGYTGYATDRLLRRYSLWQVALLVGVLHAVWHYPSMFQIGQSVGLMLTGTLFTIAVRIVMVWLYRETGSVCLTIVFHAMGNTARSCFPGGRAAFEQHDAVVGYGVIVTLAIVIIVADTIRNRSSTRS